MLRVNKAMKIGCLKNETLEKICTIFSHIIQLFFQTLWQMFCPTIFDQTVKMHNKSRNSLAKES